MRNPSINEKVRQLEIGQEVLVGQVRAMCTKQDEFFGSWNKQQDENRRQKDEDRRLADATARNNRITLPQLFAMGAALVTMLIAIGGLNLYMIDNRISGAVAPLTERQNATTEASLVRSTRDGDRDRVLSEATSSLAELVKQVETNAESLKEVAGVRDRLTSLEADVKAEAEIRRIKDTDTSELLGVKIESVQEELRRFKARVEK